MTGRDHVTAIVLAGGRSSRFGGPKLAAALDDGSTVLDHALRAATSIAREIVVAGPPAAAATAGAAGDSVRFVADEEAFAGPLAALAGALRGTTTDLAIVVGGDMPGLVPAVLDLLLAGLRSDPGLDAVVLEDAVAREDDAPRDGPAGSRRRQVLPLALRVAPASVAATAAVGAGDRSLIRLLDRLRSSTVPAAEWLALDPAGRTLLDVDRPADLERIRRELR